MPKCLPDSEVVNTYPVAKIARDLDVSGETLRKWVNQAEIDAGRYDDRALEVQRAYDKTWPVFKLLKRVSVPQGSGSTSPRESPQPW
jgi:transposase-like protein